MEKRSRHSPFGRDNLNQKAWTFFFSNFLEKESESSMWKTFACLGVVVDLYIARKKSNWGKRFGFVRFIKVKNWRSMEDDLNNIWIGNFKIRANLARFGRNVSSFNRGSGGRTERKPITIPRSSSYAGNDKWSRSFADVVKGGSGVNSLSGAKVVKTHKEVVLHSSKENLVKLESSLIGELKSFDELNSIGEIGNMEGWPEVRVSYIGGLSVQLDFTSNKSAIDFLERAGAVWKDWVISLRRWSIECPPSSRIALLDIHGIPLQAWNVESLITIGKLWGDVVNSNLEGARGCNKSASQVFVLTKKMDWIMDTVEALIDNVKYSIRVIERVWDGWESGEIMYSDRETINRNCRDDASSWTSKFGGESNANLPTENLEGPMISEPAANSPVSTPVVGHEVEGSPKHLDDREELKEVSRSRSETIRMGGCTEELSGKLEQPARDNQTHSLSVISPNDVDQSGPWPKRSGPLNSIGSPASSKTCRRGQVAYEGSIGDCYAEEDADSDYAREEGDGWLPQCKIDGMERRKKRAKKFKAMKSPCNCARRKRGFACKHSKTEPCNCARRKRGFACKHSKTEGSTVGKSFILERDNQDSSDSENLIRLMLKLLSWNANGMGKEYKRLWAKEAVKTHKISFLCVQETKLAISSVGQVRSIWGNYNMDFAALDLTGNSSGIITIRDGSLFTVNRTVEIDGFVLVSGKSWYWRSTIEWRQSWPVGPAVQEERKADSRGRQVTKTFRLVSSCSLRSRRTRDQHSLDSCGRGCILHQLLFRGREVSLRVEPAKDDGKIWWDLRVRSRMEKQDRRKKNNSKLGVINVYAPQSTNSKKTLWDNILKELQSESDVAWLVCGDFNEVRSAEERKGSVVDPRGTKAFNEFIATAGLFDLRLGGRKFTYLVNQNFLDIWPLANALALPRVLSDHCPILLDSQGNDFGPTPFKLFNSWLNNPEFEALVKEKWKDDMSACEISSKIDILSWKLRRLKSDIKIWSTLSRQKNEAEIINLKNKISALDLLAEPAEPAGRDACEGKSTTCTQGKDFVAAVKYFETHNNINSGSNSSFITLIPKIKDPQSLADYRPINLIGCVSKVIAKVLAERLKNVVGSVISNSQTTFIKGRNILDGPLMVNELINWAKMLRKKMLIFKVDFAKAFDSLNWNFLDSILIQMGFGDKWRDWMKGCICTAKVSVLVNGRQRSSTRGRG
ncbi:hypothetical protein OSB04_011206 [Centaurea solstitialis]|uniref:RRM domain-containing protein n=1 Tax=Centaurea solstitialis TaxID=347529 RepID=A0AA38WDH2_9ASTR|nr:hypothetical protein OSB04_011206 [Centaurea solstitialis]